MPRFRLLAPLLALAVSTGAPRAHAQAEGPEPAARYYAPAPGSRFWIDGRTPLAPFTCAADEVGGHGRLRGEAVTAEVVVPVRAFDCGLGRMNQDLYGALQGRVHPAIRLALADVRRVGGAQGGWTPLRVTGTLRLAGVTRPVTLEAQGRLTPEGHVLLRGRHALRMTDFGITPPAGPFGLVRADDRITVRFELVAVPRASVR